jgi:Fe-S-cluster containining protein
VSRPGIAVVDTSELRGLRFACIEECGFCCTFTPEVAHDELARLRQRFPRLPVARSGPAVHLAFQGGCGACTLLVRRRCTAYEDRPAHCRYFPFHVYFGRRTEVYVNRTCRGVDPDPAGDLQAAFTQQVMEVARPHAFAEHGRLARRVHAEFERNARQAGAWGDVAEAVRRTLAGFDGWVDDAVAGPAWGKALEPYRGDDVVARPFHLAPDLRWITWESRGGTLQALTMEETGDLLPLGDPIDPAPPRLTAALREAIRGCLAFTAGRECFAGQAFDLVDTSGYAVSVDDAVRHRLLSMAADLALGSVLLAHLGQDDATMASELGRFYDARFLDAPAIGGWL